MNKYNKEEKEFLSLLDKQNAVANPMFKAQLKTKMLRELEPKTGFFGFLNTASFSFLAVIVFSFITVMSGFLIISELNKNDTVKISPVVSDQIKQQVVEKVSEKTSVTALNLLKVDNLMESDTIAKPIKPIEEDYNFKTTEVTYIPKSDYLAVCSNLNLPEKLTVTQLYEYFDDNRAVSKIKKDNQTLAVVEFPEEEIVPTSFPVSYAPVSFAVPQDRIEDKILDLSSNFELTENLLENTKTFVITDYVMFNCTNPLSYPASFTDNQDKIIREFILNPDFSVKTVNLYLNQIAQDNRLAEINITASTKTITREVADQILLED